MVRRRGGRGGAGGSTGRAVSQARAGRSPPTATAELTTFLREGMGRRGAMELDGRRYELARARLVEAALGVDDGRDELAELTTRHTFKDERGRASAHRRGPASPHAALLALLGAHLALLSAREQAARRVSARSGPWR